jgi:putative transposase
VMQAVSDAGQDLGFAVACDALGVSRASHYRWRSPVFGPHAQKASPRALTAAERVTALGVLHEDRFLDQPPAEVYATLLDEGGYLASISTLYRILRDHDEVRERRSQREHPRYAAPELLAERPNEVWSWDITKLKGPQKWSYYHLYVILDIFSRYVVGWMVAHRESAVLAQNLECPTCVTMIGSVTCYYDCTYPGGYVSAQGVAQVDLLGTRITCPDGTEEPSRVGEAIRAVGKIMKDWF